MRVWGDTRRGALATVPGVFGAVVERRRVARVCETPVKASCDERVPWPKAGGTLLALVTGWTQLGEGFMESVVGFLAVAGGFGVALGLTMLGMNAVLSIMPTRRR
jgi:hypothetical protein